MLSLGKFSKFLYLVTNLFVIGLRQNSAKDEAVQNGQMSGNGEGEASC